MWANPHCLIPWRERISPLLKDTPGVTRDRIYADVTWLNHDFTLIDTGGIEPDSNDIILAQMRRAGTDCYRYRRCDHFPGGCASGTAGCRFQGGRYAAPFPQAGDPGSQQSGQLSEIHGRCV